MNLLKGLCTLACALALVSGTSQAEVLIDDFGTGGAGTGSDAVRTFGPTTNTLVSIVGPNLEIQGSNAVPAAAERSAEVNYSWGSGNEPFLGYERFLTFDVVSTVGDWAVEITYRGGGTGKDANLMFAIADGTTGDVSVDLATGGNSGHLNGVEDLELTFFNTAASGFGNRSLTIGSLAAVPEPTSIALLGLTGLGGVVIARRRRKVEEAA